jgi:molecular chaperone DnaJ
VKSHESLVRDGDDLIYRQDITMIEAALGTTAYVPALDGDIEMELPPGTQPGQTKVYRNRGVPVLQGSGRGDLKVVVNVLVPRQLSDEQREVLEQFAALTADTDYEPDQGFLDKVRAVFHQ